MQVINQYEWLFDPVEFGIDMREWRLREGRSQREVDDALGLSGRGTYTSSVECGRTPEGMSMRLFLRFCSLMDADPRKYFSIQHA